MADKEKLVDFVAKPGVTIYGGGAGVGHAPGSKLRLPESHAEDLGHLRADPAAAAPAPASTPAPATPPSSAKPAAEKKPAAEVKVPASLDPTPSA